MIKYKKKIIYTDKDDHRLLPIIDYAILSILQSRKLIK